MMNKNENLNQGAEKKVSDYVARKYSIEITEDDDGVVATIPDLPGCASFGDSIEEAIRNLSETKELWIRGRLESNQPIPEPSRIDEFSGKFVVRLPRVLHKSLDRQAKQQGVSLNQYILHLLSERNALFQMREATQQRYPERIQAKFKPLPAECDLHWAEERHCLYSFVSRSASQYAGSTVLSNISVVHKPVKDFKKLLPVKDISALKTTYQS